MDAADLALAGAARNVEPVGFREVDLRRIDRHDPRPETA
jgi:hypothetical protein